MELEMTPPETIYPADCPECGLRGVKKRSCPTCNRDRFYCVGCGHRVHPPAQYRLSTDCDCWVDNHPQEAM